VISSLLTLLGLASIVAGVVVTAFVRAKKLGEEWEYQGAVGDLRRVRSHHGRGPAVDLHRSSVGPDRRCRNRAPPTGPSIA
jgi:hypothetical protein